MTGMAAKEVFPGIAGDRIYGRLESPLNPTTRTLEVPADLRLKIENALRAEARRTQLRLYFRLPGLYLHKFGLQARFATLKLYSNIASYFLELIADRHG